MMEKYQYCGGIIGQDSGEICRWGRIPHPFVMANDGKKAKRLIGADRGLPSWVCLIAEREDFIPLAPWGTA
jgi:hypothetical protein